MARKIPARERRRSALLAKSGVYRPVAMIDAANNQGDDVASAAALPLATATGSFVSVTGSVNVTSIPESPAGVVRKVVFADDGGDLVHSSALQLPVPIITREAGDTAEFISLGDGNWKLFNYIRASGDAIFTYHGTSTTSITASIGVKTLTVDADRAWFVGMRLKATSDSANNIWFEGDVNDYTGTSLQIRVDSYENAAAAAKADWIIDLGSFSQCRSADFRTYLFLFDCIQRKGHSLPSATTLDINDAANGLPGSYHHITGAATIEFIASPENVATADHYGQMRVLVFDGALTLTHSGRLILPTSANITTAAGDIAVFVYEELSGNSIWRCVNYMRADGSALSLSNMTACSVLGRAANSVGAAAAIDLAESELLGRVGNVVNGFTLDDFTADDPAMADALIFADASASNETNSTTVSKLLGFASSSICEGRLTFSSSVNGARTSNDATGVSTIYFTPDIGDRITIYDNTRLRLYTFSQMSLALSGLATPHIYDVFIYDNSGTLTLEALAWQNATVTLSNASPCVVTWTGYNLATFDTVTFTTTGALPAGVSASTQYWITVIDGNTFKLSTSLINAEAGTFVNSSSAGSGVHTGYNQVYRGTALVKQNGAWYKTGDLTRRWLGSFMTTASNTTEDSQARPFLQNAHNRCPRTVKAMDGSTASWTYGTATWRSANATATNTHIEIINVIPGVNALGADSEPIDLLAAATVGAQAIMQGIGVNRTTVSACTAPDGLTFLCDPAGGATILPASATLKKVPRLGYTWYQWIENGISGIAGTSYNYASGGRQSGMHGMWWH